MTRKHFTIVLVGSLWEVRHGRRREPDLTNAVRQAIGEKKSLETQRKAARFLARFVNFSHCRHEPWDAFMAESVVVGRRRIEAYLRSLNFQVVYETNRIDGSAYVRAAGNGSVSTLPVGLAALSRLYTAMHRMGLRPAGNPTKVDGWHRLLPTAKLEMAMAVIGPKARYGGYKGSHYIASGLAPSPLRIEDPVGLGPRLLAAGKAAGWPAAIYDLVTVMSDDGPRWADTSPLTAADWGRSSGFGRTLWAPNKTSGGVRVKQIVVTARSAMQLRVSFDTDVDRPDMADLETLLRAGDWAALERIYLFPSKTGRPHSYHVYNNEYLRPAVEAAGLEIHSKIGAKRPTGHRLRAARIQAEVDHIYRPGQTQVQIDADTEQLREDVHIRNRQAFERYLGERREERALAAKIVRFDRMLERHAASRTQGDVPPPRSTQPRSRAEQRQEAIG